MDEIEYQARKILANYYGAIKSSSTDELKIRACFCVHMNLLLDSETITEEQKKRYRNIFDIGLKINDKNNQK